MRTTSVDSVDLVDSIDLVAPEIVKRWVMRVLYTVILGPIHVSKHLSMPFEERRQELWGQSVGRGKGILHFWRRLSLTMLYVANSVPQRRE
jgi:hypothetical protein